ncbi:MAG: PEP-CTERM sorting domain-containing protein [Crocosphaera sp.]
MDNVVADAAESVPEPGAIVALAMVGGSSLLRKGTKRG